MLTTLIRKATGTERALVAVGCCIGVATGCEQSEADQGQALVAPSSAATAGAPVTSSVPPPSPLGTAAGTSAPPAASAPVATQATPDAVNSSSAPDPTATSAPDLTATSTPDLNPVPIPIESGVPSGLPVTSPHTDAGSTEILPDPDEPVEQPEPVVQPEPTPEPVSYGPVRIYLVGDSTMTDYSVRDDYMTNYYPMTGWGEKLDEFLTEENLAAIVNLIPASSAEVFNWAMGGRSTRSFWEEGRWQQVLDLLEPGDYVFIQFGHNDGASCADYPDRCTPIPDFEAYLRDYVDSAREMGAIPLLITPFNRNYPWANGTISNVHGDYPAAMKRVARERNAPLIDGTERSLDLFNAKGQEYATTHYFMVFPAGTYSNYKVTAQYPNGSPSNDNTHFQTEGGEAMAGLVFEGLQDLVSVQIEVDPENCGTAQGAGWYEMKYSQAVTVRVEANAGCTFQGWSGDLQGSDNPVDVPLDGNKRLIAHFEQ